MTHVYDFLGPVLGVGNGLALLLVLVLLLLGAYRRFWIVLIYVAWELLATVAFTVADVLYNGTAQVTLATETQAQRWYTRLYWLNDVLVDLLRFLLVIILIYKAIPESTKRLAVGRLLAAVVATTILLPFLIFPLSFEPFPKVAWFSSTSELLNFGAAIMNLVLWAALIASKRRDPQLLMVSAGLGVVVTGAAISYGLRHFIPKGAFTSVLNLFLNLTQLGGWAIWCWAFWPPARRRHVPDNAVSSR